MGPYPVVLDLGGRPVLVVGGGAVAERKVEGLLAAGASMTVVSEELERLVGSDYAVLTDLAGEVRLELRARGEQATADAWTTALRGDVRRLVAAGRRDEARRRLLQALRPA